MQTRVLTDAQIAQVHRASLRILAEIGVQVPHAEMLDRFAAAGAEVDRAGERVRIPSAVVDRCIASAGKQFTLYGRDLARTARFGQGQRNKVEPLPADLDKAVSALVAAARAGEAV